MMDAYHILRSASTKQSAQKPQSISWLVPKVSRAPVSIAKVTTKKVQKIVQSRPRCAACCDLHRRYEAGGNVACTEAVTTHRHTHRRHNSTLDKTLLKGVEAVRGRGQRDLYGTSHVSRHHTQTHARINNSTPDRDAATDCELNALSGACDASSALQSR